MTIRAATKFAIVGVGLGSAMHIAGQFLSAWASPQLPGGTLIRLLRTYYIIAAIFEASGLLIFFVTLSSKQKARDDGRP